MKFRWPDGRIDEVYKIIADNLDGDYWVYFKSGILRLWSLDYIEDMKAMSKEDIDTVRVCAKLGLNMVEAFESVKERYNADLVD